MSSIQSKIKRYPVTQLTWAGLGNSGTAAISGFAATFTYTGVEQITIKLGAGGPIPISFSAPDNGLSNTITRINTVVGSTVAYVNSFGSGILLKYLTRVEVVSYANGDTDFAKIGLPQMVVDQNMGTVTAIQAPIIGDPQQLELVSNPINVPTDANLVSLWVLIDNYHNNVAPFPSHNSLGVQIYPVWGDPAVDPTNPRGFVEYPFGTNGFVPTLESPLTDNNPSVHIFKADSIVLAGSIPQAPFLRVVPNLPVTMGATNFRMLVDGLISIQTSPNPFPRIPPFVSMWAAFASV